MEKKALRPLIENLHHGEEVLDWVTGMSMQTMVLTPTRVIVIKPGLMAGTTFGSNVSSFALSEISSFEFAKHWGMSYLIVRTAGSPVVSPTSSGRNSGYKLPNVIPISNAGQAQLFMNSVNFVRLQPQTAPAAPPHPDAPAAPASVADEIAKLVALKEAGHLSDEEFAVQKARALG